MIPELGDKESGDEVTDEDEMGAEWSVYRLYHAGTTQTSMAVNTKLNFMSLKYGAISPIYDRL